MKTPVYPQEMLPRCGFCNSSIDGVSVVGFEGEAFIRHGIPPHIVTTQDFIIICGKCIEKKKEIDPKSEQPLSLRLGSHVSVIDPPKFSFECSTSEEREEDKSEHIYCRGIFLLSGLSQRCICACHNDFNDDIVKPVKNLYRKLSRK